MLGDRQWSAAIRTWFRQGYPAQDLVFACSPPVERLRHSVSIVVQNGYRIRREFVQISQRRGMADFERRLWEIEPPPAQREQRISERFTGGKRRRDVDPAQGDTAQLRDLDRIAILHDEVADGFRVVAPTAAHSSPLSENRLP